MNDKSNITSIPGPVKNPQTTKTPGKNKHTAYPLRTYIGANLLKKAEDNEGFKKAIKDYEGIVLFVSHLSIEVFKSKFDKNFVTSVLKTKTGGQKVQNVNHVNEVIVYIPEISGCLPLPDMTPVSAFINNVKKSKNISEVNTIENMKSYIDENGSKQSLKDSNNITKQLRRLDRMPRFYCIDTTTSGRPMPDKRVEVTFPNEGDYTKGILKKVY